MKLRIWSFVAGDSKRTPLGIALAAIVALLLVHLVPAAGAWIGVAYVALVAAAFAAGVFER